MSREIFSDEEKIGNFFASCIFDLYEDFDRKEQNTIEEDIVNNGYSEDLNTFIKDNLVKLMNEYIDLEYIKDRVYLNIRTWYIKEEKVFNFYNEHLKPEGYIDEWYKAFQPLEEQLDEINHITFGAFHDMLKYRKRSRRNDYMEYEVGSLDTVVRENIFYAHDELFGPFDFDNDSV